MQSAILKQKTTLKEKERQLDDIEQQIENLEEDFPFTSIGSGSEGYSDRFLLLG